MLQMLTCIGTAIWASYNPDNGQDFGLDDGSIRFASGNNN